jgi:hypothetical protein
MAGSARRADEASVSCRESRFLCEKKRFFGWEILFSSREEPLLRGEERLLALRRAASSGWEKAIFWRKNRFCLVKTRFSAREEPLLPREDALLRTRRAASAS